MSPHSSHRRRIEVVLPALLIAVISLTLLVRIWPAPTAWTDAVPVTLRVNINEATQTELRLLPGIGPALAGKIVANRDTAGPFRSISALDRVKGIGPITINKLAPFITADAEQDAAPLH
jgi:competence ComEA-like helix-hairpin-helix protein